MNLVEDYLATADLADASILLREFRPSGFSLVTPRYPDSRHVVVVLLDSIGQPRVVGKVVRRPDDQSTLGAEARVLTRLATDVGPRIGAPRLLAFVQHKQHWLLLETALRGRPLTHSAVRRHPKRTWQVVEDWIRALPVTSTTAARGWFEDEIAKPFEVAASALRPSVSERELFASTKHLLRELADAALPAPIEHGDLSHPNLLVTRAGAPAIIDWETGRIAGLPGGDAAVFLAFVAFSVARAHGAEREATCYGREFLVDGALGRRRLAEHLERCEVDPKWLDLILLATWSRYAVQVFPRMLAGEAAAYPDAARTAADLFRSGRALRLWRMTHERVVG